MRDPGSAATVASPRRTLRPWVSAMVDSYPGLRAIMRARARMLTNGMLRAGRQRRAWALVLTVLVAGALDLSYSFARSVLTVTPARPDTLASMFGGGLVLLCAFTAVSSVTFALSSLYFSRDLEGLLSSPVPPRVVVISRMLTQLALGVGIGAVIAGPPLLAYTVTVGRPWASLGIGMVVICLAVTPLALATGLVIAGVRLIPARYVRGAGGIIITIAVFGVTAANLFFRGAEAFTARSASSLDLGSFRGLAETPWEPIGWTSRSVAGWLNGDWLTGALWSLPVIGAALIALIVVSRLGEAAFVTGYQRNAGSSRRRRLDRSTRQAVVRDRVGPLWLALAVKDAREIRRDASQLTQLILPLIIFALYIGSPGLNPGDLSATSLPRWFGTALTAAFASLFCAAGIPLRAVGAEGERLWILRSAPIPPGTVLRGKYALGFTVAFGLGGLLLALGEWRGGTGMPAAAAAMVLFAVIVAGLVALAIGLGAMRPRLDWTDPRRAIGIGTSLTFLGIGAAYLTLCFVCLAVPYAAAPGSAVGVIVGDLALVVLASLSGAAALLGGGRRLAVLEA